MEAFRQCFRLGPPVSVSAFGSTGVHVRIANDARRSVVFFGVTGPNGIQYGGTGFTICDSEQGVPVPFLVTCRHVAKALEKFDEFFIRLNTKAGGAVDIPVQEIEWTYPPDETVDLAAISLGIDQRHFDIVYYPADRLGIASTKDDPEKVVCGDPVNIVGLFRLHFGSQRLVPFVHTGNVAVLADSNELIPVIDRLTREPVKMEAHLIEAQTLDGLSGSPVFIHETVGLEGFDLGDGLAPKAYGMVRLLGLYAGSWDGEPGTILAEDRDLRGNVRVPVGVGVVVPGDKILELIREHPEMKEAREMRVKAKLRATAASQDSALGEPKPVGASPTEANPKHREDFNSLLSAAAQTREQED